MDKYLVSESAELIHVLECIESNKSGFAIVMNNNKEVVGTVTDGDIRRYIIHNKNLSSPASQFMSRNFEYLNFDSNFSDIVKKFRSSKVNFLPVVDEYRRFHHVLKKSTFHFMLLEDFSLDLKKNNFDDVFNKTIDHEVFEKPWGYYKTTMFSSHAQSKVVTIFPGQELSLQLHEHREEHWVIIKGSGKATLQETIMPIYAGKYVFVPKGCKHKLTNSSETENLIVSEVQLGDYFGEDDIIRFEDKYGRN